ncbi:MAG TPA: zinc ribbon domain-containing protein [Pyrinomonadaceae bacterium]|nr:zinc ribbon domain-containing protein [Pyrinomonadaceae bacterium]
MPIYEYSCQKCHARVEVMQKITDKPLKRCESCGGKLEKEWSTSSFQLKGTGWYVTDYARKKTADADKEPAKTVSAPDAKTGGAADAKAAAPAETKSESAPAAEETLRKKTSRPVATSKSSKSD